MKAFTKLLLVGAVAGAGYMVYKQRMASRAEDDLWSEATNAPDLSTAYQPVFDSAAPESGSVADQAAAKVSEQADAAAAKVSEQADAVAEKAGSVADSAAAKADKAADKVADATQKVADKAADAAPDKN